MSVKLEDGVAWVNAGTVTGMIFFEGKITSEMYVKQTLRQHFKELTEENVSTSAHVIWTSRTL
jgi:hypothetical protein